MTDRKLTIEELEKLLDAEEESHIEILPNGTIRERQGTKKRSKGKLKVLTMREDLGGEYGLFNLA